MKDKHDIVSYVNSREWTEIGNWKSTILNNELSVSALSHEYLKALVPFEVEHAMIMNGPHYLSKADYDRLGKYYYDMISKDPGFLEHICKLLDRVSYATIKELRKCASIEQFFKAIRKVMSLGVAIVPLDASIEKYLSEKGYPADFQNHVFPIKKAFMFKEKIDFLKLKIRESHGKDITREIKAHARKYGWLNTINWKLDQFDEEYYLNQLEQIELGKAKQELARLTDSAKTEDEIRKYLAGKTPEQKKMLRVLRQLLDAKMLNWDVVGLSNTKLRELLKKDQVLRKIDYNVIVNLMSDEVISLKKGRISPEQAKKLYDERKDERVAAYPHRIGSVIKLTPEIKSRLDLMRKGKEAHEKVDIIKGTAVFNGKVIAKVQIIESPKDCHKMEKGNVLVCPMTNPDFMPAVAKAAAIITDEGGMLCHAAIVSRELNIPCIVGTKIATKALRNGELVEVDAVNGVVRKIK